MGAAGIRLDQVKARFFRDCIRFQQLTAVGPFVAFKLATGKEGMGYGDFKLLAALGAWLGWQALPLIIIVSSFVGAVLGVTMLVLQSKDRNTTIPFGPYLAIAGWIALIWSHELISWYLSFAGIN